MYASTSRATAPQPLNEVAFKVNGTNGETYLYYGTAKVSEINTDYNGRTTMTLEMVPAGGHTLTVERLEKSGSTSVSKHFPGGLS